MLCRQHKFVHVTETDTINVAHVARVEKVAGGWFLVTFSAGSQAKLDPDAGAKLLDAMFEDADDDY